jgi:K+/H+ antiporter YhaU regulatory subunit KhtT
MQRIDGHATYQRIALDLAQRIVNMEFEPGQRLHGRSTLASMYNVSPETIRRAVALLQDMHVVEVKPGSGITITETEAAYRLVERLHGRQSIGSLKQDLLTLLDRRVAIEKELLQTVDQIIAYSDQLKNLSPYNPIEIKIRADSWVVGHNVAELRFWQETGGTIVALRRGEEILISPGPFLLFAADDVVVVVGEDGIRAALDQYLNRTDKSADA